MKSRRKRLLIKIALWNKIRILKKGKEPPPWIIPFRHWVYIILMTLLGYFILESGLRLRLPDYLRIVFRIIEYAFILMFLIDAFLIFYHTYPRQIYLRKQGLDVVVLLICLSHLIPLHAGTSLIMIRYGIFIFRRFIKTPKLSNVLHRIRLNTAQIIAISFLSTILIGTILLLFPASTTNHQGTSFVDALFTATSATCVTGLIVQDTPVYFSKFGQTVILVLIQLGGLGIMTYSVFVAILIGRFTLGQRKLVQEMFEEERNIYNTIRYIFKMTMTIELIGILLLFLRWNFYFNHPLQALYFSIFHSISAFCNAGFSLFSDSLSQFSGDPFINVIMISLIISGGLGFIVIYELTHFVRGHRKYLSPHSKLVLLISAALILIGFLSFFFFEFDGVLMKESLFAKIWASVFQSVTARTAGFNTVSIASLKSVTLTILILLMFIGASPGSTGGGIKTSTFAILLLSVRSLIRGDESIKAFHRTIPPNIIRKAIALMVSALFIISLIFLLLLAIENKPYVNLLFETISAFGTVGLSTGITPNLTMTGKLLIILLMYLGRIGPLTMGLALTREISKGKIIYPEARVMIG